MPFVLPQELLERLPRGATVVEVGVGGRGALLTAIQEARPDLHLVATDVRPEALEGELAGADTYVDDVFEPDAAIYQGASLIIALRCPEELQAPLARLAASTGAGLAIHALKDEWADVTQILGSPTLARGPEGTGWRIWSALVPP